VVADPSAAVSQTPCGISITPPMVQFSCQMQRRRDWGVPRARLALSEARAASVSTIDAWVLSERRKTQ
jgi:hypothetical protein